MTARDLDALPTLVGIASLRRHLIEPGTYADCAACHAEGVELACEHGRALCAGCADLCGECHDGYRRADADHPDPWGPLPEPTPVPATTADPPF